MPVFEQQETPRYAALVWPIESTQFKSDLHFHSEMGQFNPAVCN